MDWQALPSPQRLPRNQPACWRGFSPSYLGSRRTLVSTPGRERTSLVAARATAAVHAGLALAVVTPALERAVVHEHAIVPRTRAGVERSG